MTDMVYSFQAPGPRLYICSTPIGNLQDVSLRLLDVLREADVVAAEDTRQTKKLLTRFDIHPPILVSYHAHNRRSRESDFLLWWEAGKSVALVSDAGTPGISDPGDDAAALAARHGVPVIPVPGASAVLAALVASGLPSLPFTFAGFLPRDAKGRRAMLETLKRAPGSVVLYESPHRLQRTLADLAALWPERKAVLAKELTKRYEGFARGTLQELVSYAQTNRIQGEYVVVLGPADLPLTDRDRMFAEGGPGGGGGTDGGGGTGGGPNVAAAGAVDAAGDAGWPGDALEQAKARVKGLIEQGERHGEAVRRIAAQTGVRRSDLYRATLEDESGERP